MEKILSVRDVAGIIDCSVVNVYRLVKIGVLSARRLRGGRRLYFLESDIMEALKNG